MKTIWFFACRAMVAIEPDNPRLKAAQGVLDDWVSDGRMIKVLADFGCGFARGTIVYQIVPAKRVVPLSLGVRHAFEPAQVAA